MRFLTPAVAAAALLAAQASPGFAQTTTPPAASAPAVPAPAPAPAPAVPPSTTVPETTAPPAATAAPAPAPLPPKPRKHAKRVSLHEHFMNANTTQDGHLTLDQAKTANWKYIVRHFDAMDRDHKGYVTEADIHAYSVAQRAARRAAAKTTPPAATPGQPAPPPPPAPAQ